MSRSLRVASKSPSMIGVIALSRMLHACLDNAS